MSVKRAVSFLIMVSVISSLFIVPENASAYDDSLALVYDFESGMSGWEMGTTSRNAGLELLNENNNSFLRLTAKSGDSYRLQDNIDIVPNIFVQLEKPYVMAPDSETIISADVRTSETKLIRNLMVNRDQLNSEVSKEVQYNFATIWNWDKSNKISTFEQTQTTSVGGYKKARSNTAFNSLENDKWYTFCVVFYTDESGLPEELELRVSDGDTVNLTTERRTIVNETLRLSNEITRLDFDLANAAVTLTEDAVLDIDNVKIYQNTDKRFCRIKCENEGNVFNGDDSIILAFNAPMDADTVNTENIELYDSDNNKIEYDGEYSDSLWEYTVSPKETLKNGKYTFRISYENLNGIGQDGAIISITPPEDGSELQFTVFKGDLPEVKDLSISGKNIEGNVITASGEYYQGSGIDGRLIWQWWYSTSEDRNFIKIDGENSDEFTVPNGFTDKYIRVSAIPLTDSGVRGKEVFSNVICPPAAPTVKRVEVNGEILSGETLTAQCEYYQEDGISGYLKYQWWYSTTKDGTYEKIEGALGSSFSVTDEFSDKFIKLSVTPFTDDNMLVGEEVFSDITAPLSKPCAQDAVITGVSVCGTTLTIDYTFVDDNDDGEADSIYEWFISSDGSGEWTKLNIENTRDYVISDEDEGKYIKARITPVADREPSVGDAVETNTVGPVKSVESLNLVANPGFEDGQTTGWGVHNIGGDTATISAIRDYAYSGQWCGKFEGQTLNSTYMVYGVNLEAGTRYIEACMMKVAPDSAKDNVQIAFYGEGNPERSYKYSEQNIIKKSGWNQVSQIISVKSGGRFSEMPQYWANGSPGYVAYLDDFYIAPLLVYDISANVPESIDIPISGETSRSISILAVSNQLGTDLGMEDETAYWELDRGVDGVYIKDDMLYVTSNARSGTIKLKAVCIPNYDGAVQKRFVKAYPVTLVANGNKTPRIISANLSGNTSERSNLTLDYDFYQTDNCGDESTVEWYVSDTVDGVYVSTGKTGRKFEVTEDYIEKYIKAEITPFDSEGREGQKVFSNIAGPKTPPKALNVKIAGKGYIGDIIKSEYTYYDFNGDEEGSTRFQWLRSRTENGEYESIPGAVGPEYTVTEDDSGCYIKLSVKPVSKKIPYDGDETLSNAIAGPKAPYVKSVTVTRTGDVMTGRYVYVNDNGTEEGSTVCEWLVNGTVVETGTRFEPSFRITTNVEFRVTPVAVKEPKTGESESAFYSFTVKNAG